MSGGSRPGYEPIGMALCNNEWVMTWRSPDGSVVTADGGPGRSEYTVESEYSHSVMHDGDRYEMWVDVDSGEQKYIDQNGNEVDTIDPHSVDLLTAPPIHVAVFEGQAYSVYSAPDGTQRWIDSDGNVTSPLAPEFEYDEMPTFSSFAIVGGRRAFVGELDGEPCLYSSKGRPIDRVEWEDVTTVDPGPLEGRPLAIGNYSINGEMRPVFLFPDGSQAVMDASGTYERVIVPTELDYPRGRPVFEGEFEVGADGNSLGALQTFSFADGTTAYMVDGQMTLVADTGLVADYPEGVPVNCGQYPGGELFVYPDGRQMLRQPDGSWTVGDLPAIPPYEELRAAELADDAVADDAVADDGAVDDAVVDDLVADDAVAADAVADDEPSDELPDPEQVDAAEPAGADLFDDITGVRHPVVAPQGALTVHHTELPFAGLPADADGVAPVAAPIAPDGLDRAGGTSEFIDVGTFEPLEADGLFTDGVAVEEDFSPTEDEPGDIEPDEPVDDLGEF